jgi:LmbE family N-acetylglucosaminyl deacetylase
VCLHPLRELARTFFSIALLSVAAWGQVTAPTSPSWINPADPLPPDTGTAGLREMLLRLHTTARLMQTVAHPDDEDGGMLTLESRGKGVTVTLLTLNRGEGGQNKLGSNLFDVLGVLRTLELLGADQYYGVEQRFTRVADFGFSKTADETFQKWQGHDIALGDMVRVIRTFRPDVLVARFSGADRDGHGHHQASSILTREAFRAAADPNRFPEQIKEGLLPWQPKKLYIGNICGFGATTCPDENWTVKLNTGKRDSTLGMSYAQFAMQGLKHQLSQGAGGWSVDPGDRFAFYKLVDSVLPPATDKNGHEQDLFDGIDTSLPGLAARLGAEETKAPFLRPALAEMQTDIDQATSAAERDPVSAAMPLLSGLKVVTALDDEIEKSTLSQAAKDDLLANLNTKRNQFEEAANLALAIEFHVNAETPPGTDDSLVATPGRSFRVSATFVSRRQMTNAQVHLDLPPGWKDKLLSSQASSSLFEVTVPPDAPYARPYWHRDDPESEAINHVDDSSYLTLPFPPPPVQAHVDYTIDGLKGVARAIGVAQKKTPIAVGPAFSVKLEPSTHVIPVQGGSASQVRVAVSSALQETGQGVLRLQVPDGWRAEPSSVQLKFATRGEKRECDFQLFPSNRREGRAEVRAVLDADGKHYSEGYTVVTREDLGTFYYYQPAMQRISIVDVNAPRDLKVGYIMGAGDEIPAVLKQIGMDVTLIPAERLATENLTQYGTIVLGIRANDTQKEIAEHHQKLLDYVSSGGTLLVQYNTGVSDFNKDNLTPFHAQLSRARVSVEDAPVEILAPQDAIFHYPNQINQHDFDDWVQERGLYFMDQWDDHFVPLLASHDPTEPEQKGGLLLAHYGKGVYIYTGYAFFRQLPAGVPGAIRLYVNLLSAGHEAR